MAARSNPRQSFKSRIFPCKNTVAVGSAVVEMSVCIDDCCPAGECHLLGLQCVPGGAGRRRREYCVLSFGGGNETRLRSQRPRRPAGEQRDELAAHSVPPLQAGKLNRYARREVLTTRLQMVRSRAPRKATAFFPLIFFPLSIGSEPRPMTETTGRYYWPTPSPRDFTSKVSQSNLL